MIFEMAAQNERENFCQSKLKNICSWKEGDYFQWPYYLVQRVWDAWCDLQTNWCRTVEVMFGKIDYRKVAVQLTEKILAVYNCDFEKISY